MLVFAFDVRRTIDDEADIEKTFADLMAQGLNSFLLSDGDGSFPVLSVAVNKNLATLSYLLREDDPGWRSLGSVLGPEGESLFSYQAPNAKEPVPNRFVITYAQAFAAATEFFRDRSLPSAVTWWDL